MFASEEREEMYFSTFWDFWGRPKRLLVSVFAAVVVVVIQLDALLRLITIPLQAPLTCGRLVSLYYNGRRRREGSHQPQCKQGTIPWFDFESDVVSVHARSEDTRPSCPIPSTMGSSSHSVTRRVLDSTPSRFLICRCRVLCVENRCG